MISWWFTYVLLTIGLWFTYVLFLRTYYSTYDLLWLLRISSAQWTRSSELFIKNYWLVAHFRAALLMYHHRLPSPVPFFKSQIAPLKSCSSVRMENRKVPVSPTGTSASLQQAQCRQQAQVQDWSNGYTIQNSRLHTALVNNFRVTFISCHYTEVSTINNISTLSNISNNKWYK
jgi:hypothetical protein